MRSCISGDASTAPTVKARPSSLPGAKEAPITATQTDDPLEARPVTALPPRRVSIAHATRDLSDIDGVRSRRRSSQWNCSVERQWEPRRCLWCDRGRFKLCADARQDVATAAYNTADRFKYSQGQPFRARWRNCARLAQRLLNSAKVTVARCAIRICSRMREISPAPQTALAQRIGSFAVKLSKMLPLIVDRIR